MYVVYDHPRDFPDDFVVTRWAIRHNGETCIDAARTAPTLEAARAPLRRMGLARMPRDHDDDPCIVEVSL